MLKISTHGPKWFTNRQPKTVFFALQAIFRGEYFGLILPEGDAKKFEGMIRVAQS